MKKIALISLLVSGFAGSGIAWGQAVPPLATPAPGSVGSDGYRTNVPQVLAPAAQPQPDGGAQSIGRFRQAYAAARAPRIAIWWNRELTDEVATQYERRSNVTERTTIDMTGSGSAAVNPQVPGGVSAISNDELVGQINRTREARSGDVRVSGQARTGLAERGRWDFESGFSDAYLSAGATILDRAMIIRTIQGGRPAGQQADLQAIEAAALIGKADLLMEILMTADAAAPTGWVFRITVKNVQSGAMVMSMVSKGIPPEPATRPFVATDKGFVQATSQAPTPAIAARQLAVESMDRLATLWGVGPAPLRSSATPDDRSGLEPAVGPRARIIEEPAAAENVIRVSPLAPPAKETGNADAKKAVQ